MVESSNNEKMKAERANLMNTIKELMTINNIPRIRYSELVLDKVVGKGGQAQVYKGKYKDEEVALKVLEDIDHKCLAHEIVILSNLKHECIPKFYGLVIEDDMIGFVNKCIDGKPLDEINFNKMNEEMKIKVITKLAHTLKYIHENTFIHRDLKPENMMIDKENNFYLLDFGISKVMTNMIDTLTRAKGTIFYLAPETLDEHELTDNKEIVSKISTKVDVWAYGCIVSYLFSEILPWTNKYNDNPTAIQKVLLKKVDFPIPVEVIKEKNYKNFDLILKIIQECTIIDQSKRCSMVELIDKYLK